MIEIFVAVAAPACARGLMQALARLFDRSSISFDAASGEVCVRTEWESRSIAQAMKAVERWLAADGTISAKLAIGDRFYTLVGPACPARPGWAA